MITSFFGLVEADLGMGKPKNKVDKAAGVYVLYEAILTYYPEDEQAWQLKSILR